MTSKPHWAALDGLRCLAVSFVLFGHAGLPYPRHGGVGVDVFFVLSGFLITGILVRERENFGFINLKNFYARRALRLVPCLVVACILFALVSGLVGCDVEGWPIVITLLYLGNWVLAFTNIDMSCLGPCWSLACEEQFYLVWPLLIIVLEKWVRRASTKGLVLVACACWLALYRELLAPHVTTQRLYYALDTHADGLVLGSALAYLWRDAAGRWTKYAMPVSFGVLFVITARYGLFSPFMGRWGFFLTAVAAAIIVLDLVSRDSFWRRTLEWSPFAYLGKISYGLYLLHMPVYLLIDRMAPGLPWRVPLKIGAAIAVATLSYDFIESYFLKLKSRFT